MDESSKQLHGEKLEALPMQAGQPERYDYAYEQREMCKIFLACEPLAGKRYAKVMEQRTSQDWAYFIRELVDIHYSKAEKSEYRRTSSNSTSPSLCVSSIATESRKVSMSPTSVAGTSPKHAARPQT